MSQFKKDAVVVHFKFGRGRVRMDDGASVLVRFEHGLEECLPREIAYSVGIETSLGLGQGCAKVYAEEFEDKFKAKGIHYEHR